MSGLPGGLLGLAGALLVVVVVHDQIVTTIAVDRPSGPLTARLTAGLWRVLRPARRPGFAAYVGPTIAVCTIVTWLVGAWAGWSLVLHLNEGLVAGPDPSDAASTLQRIAAAGAALSTLGAGPFTLNSSLGGLLAAVIALHGLLTASLSITYILSITTAATARRALAVTLTRRFRLRDDDADVRARIDGLDPSAVRSAVDAIDHLTQQHLAMPILHHFATRDPHASAPHALARLVDACVDGGTDVRPEVDELRDALDRFVDTVPASGDAAAEIARATAAAHGHPLDRTGRGLDGRV